MARTTDVRTSFSAGILGAEILDRTDIEEYYNAARDMLNVDPRPGGGFQLRPGLAYYGPLRKVLAGIDLAGATITGGGQLGAPPGDAPPPDPPPDDYRFDFELPDWVQYSEGGIGYITP